MRTGCPSWINRHGERKSESEEFCKHCLGGTKLCCRRVEGRLADR
jgi:hypothetical protein